LTRTRNRSTTPPDATVNRRRAGDLVMELLKVPGVSCEERDIARRVVEILREHGLPKAAARFDNAHKKSPFGGNCGNLIVKLPGTTRAPRRLLSAHLDTVPICRHARPVRRGNTITSARKGTGVGADNRGGVGAVLTALIEILTRNLPHPPLTALFTVQEEIGLIGARYVDGRLIGKPKLAFNWDGGPPNCVEIGATGGFHLDIDVRGVPAHAGGQPERGVSAALIAAQALAELQDDGWFGLVMKKGVRGTSNIGVVHGGEATNVVMDRLRLEGECRSFSIALRKRIASAYRRAFRKAARRLVSSEGKRGSVRFSCEKKYEAFKLPGSSPSVNEVIRVLHRLDMKPELEYSNGGLDANWLAERGVFSATIGAGTDHAHTDRERLLLDQYFSGCDVALGLATGL
jgi:tripeptide aminopeptidase